MLNMSKIEAGELKLNPKAFDISAEIFNVLLSFEQIIERKHIEISGLDRLHSVTVTADEDMIHQVIYNLVDNAVKFTENGTISVFADDDENATLIKVVNTGAGISSEEREKYSSASTRLINRAAMTSRARDSVFIYANDSRNARRFDRLQQ